MSNAFLFILFFSLVSLFSDMTHEAAASIRGAFFALLGMHGATIGFISGLGELLGYSFRSIFGVLADKTKRYWTFTIAGYVLDLVCVPALALVGKNGWIFASALLLVQRMGKAMKKPSKDTLLSFAASIEGDGKTFAFQEVLDQIGAFLGPLLFYFVMLFKNSDNAFQNYKTAFAFSAIPAGFTLALLFFTKRKFPHPEQFEPEAAKYAQINLNKRFWVYILGIGFFGFGFLDYALIVLHVAKTYLAAGGVQSWLTSETLPLLYALAMVFDAVSALVFGLFYDKKGMLAPVWATIISAPFVFFVFAFHSPAMLLIGVVLWGIGMGAEESVLKAVVAKIIPKEKRATGYGIFEFAFGIFFFLGSWIAGILYDKNIACMTALSFASEMLAVVFFFASKKAEAKNLSDR